MGSYALGMGGSDCGCGTGVSGGAQGNAADMVVNGLMGHGAMNSDLIIDQGTTQETLMCFTSGAISSEIKCVRNDGVVQFAKNEKPCFKYGDLVRLVGFDNCVADATQVYKVDVAPILVNNLWEMKLIANDTITPPGPDPIAVFAHLEFVGGQYCFAGGAVAPLPIGCVQLTPREAESAPRLMMHIPAGKLAITGAVFARSDYFAEFGVSFDGTNVATSTILGRVKAGDFIQSPDAGIVDPVKVIEVRQVEVMAEGGGTKFIEKYYLEKAVPSSTCALIQVRRGLSLDLEIVQDGDCWRIIIPGADTAGMQFPEEWKTDMGYYIGKYTISATWAVLRNGKLAPRSEIIKAGNAYVRPSHLFQVPKM